MKQRRHFYGEFTKIEPTEDGHLKVYGIASSEAVDAAGEVITAEAMKAAIPAYMEFGAVREMHQSWAAGTAVKCEVNEKGQTEFEAIIVDSEAKEKVEARVYKGFSVGGNIPKGGRDPLNKNIITSINLVEISLVDRPCNPEAKLAVSKVDGADDTTVGDLRKSLYDVESFAGVLQRIGWLAQGSAWEADYEGDGSTVPAALRDWLAQGAEIFQAMAQEEIAELLATLPAPPTVEVLAMAEKLAKGEEVIEKAGRRFSKGVKEQLADIHKTLKGCDEKMAALGYEDAEEQEEGEEQEEEAEKLAKLQGDNGDLTKALDASKAEVDALKKRVADLEAMPASGPAVRDTQPTAPIVRKVEQINTMPDGLGKAAAVIGLIHGGPEA